MNEQPQDTVVIKPRIWPRDFIDVCVVLPIGLFLGALLCGVPALATFFTSRAFGVSGDTSFIAAFVACCLFYAFFLLFMVRRLTVASDGLHFHRVLGSPKFLAWDRISTIVIVSRSEVVVRGWLWPPFPSREMTPALTALRHYRISWDGGYCYYPPAKMEDFERHVVSKIQSRDI